MFFAPDPVGDGHHNTHDDQRCPDHIKIAPGSFGILLQQCSGDQNGNGADNQVPKQGTAVLIWLQAPVREAQTIANDLNPILKEENKNRS